MARTFCNFYERNKTKTHLSRNQKTKTSSLQTQRNYKKLSVNGNIEKIFAKESVYDRNPFAEDL